MFKNNMRFWNGQSVQIVNSIYMEANSDKVTVNDEFVVSKSHILKQTPYHDKNGTPIYEGDIVKTRVIDNMLGFPDMIINTIVFQKDINYSISDMESGGPDGSTNYTDILVIGNVFENKDIFLTVDPYTIFEFEKTRQ